MSNMLLANPISDFVVVLTMIVASSSVGVIAFMISSCLGCMLSHFRSEETESEETESDELDGVIFTYEELEDYRDLLS